MRSDEVLLHRHAFLQVVKDRVLNDGVALGTSLLRLGHKSAHSCELGNLVGTTTGTRVKHHEHSVEALVGLGHVFHHGLLQVVVYVCPRVNNLVVTLLISDKTHIEVGSHLVNLVLSLLHDVCLLWWHDDVVQVERKTGEIRHLVAKVLDTIKERACPCHTHLLDNDGDKATKRLL